jgi:hypothetical protein
MNAKRRARTLLAAVATVLVFQALVLGASASRAQDILGQQPTAGQAESAQLRIVQAPRDSARPFRPRFIVQAVRYRAVDETHVDFVGSDEVYGFFEDLGRNVRVRTRTRGDVDAGETRSFDANQSCMAPIGARVTDSQDRSISWTCEPAGVHAPFSIQFSLYEGDDNTPLDFCFNGQEVRPDCEDDIIGREFVTFTEADLLASLPNVGASVERTVTLGGPCGYVPPGQAVGCSPQTGPEYRFTYRITRVQNELVVPPRRV